MAQGIIIPSLKFVIKIQGGNVSEVVIDNETYVLHTFNQTSFLVTTQSFVFEYLVVAGGGDGGNQAGGGGGAGGFLSGSISVPRGFYTVIVGNNSENSSIFGIVARHGGKGGTRDPIVTNISPSSGGSGGGGFGDLAGNSFGAPGIIGQGNAGGNNRSSAPGFGTGGGGGAGANGVSAIAGQSGNGGIGKQWLFTGNKYYAGGGGGGSTNNQSQPGIGGLGGGGSGGPISGVLGVAGGPATPGEPNTGGGGGGNSSIANLSGIGGSGVVIVAYKK